MRSWLFFSLIAGIGVGGSDVQAGGKWFRRAGESSAQPPLIAPNDSVVPAWAARRMENSPVPLYAPYSGRRPWAYALSMQNTPSSRWAAASQLGIVGPGPYPGYGNGPGLGNYPQAAVGPYDQVLPPQRNPFFGFPFNAAINGY